jgi:hypothetical protein
MTRSKKQPKEDQPDRTADPKQLEVLRQGAEAWNVWRGENPTIAVNLRNADLRGANLKGYNLNAAILVGAQLHKVSFVGADLRNADLTSAVLFRVAFTGAQLAGANLTGSYLIEADVRDLDLSTADLKGADLSRVVVSTGTRWPPGVQPREPRLDPPIQEGSAPRRTVEPAPSSGHMPEERPRNQLTRSSNFSIIFDPVLSPDQIKGTLTALADYYRACGGLGLEIDFEVEEVFVREPVHVF